MHLNTGIADLITLRGIAEMPVTHTWSRTVGFWMYDYKGKYIYGYKDATTTTTTTTETFLFTTSMPALGPTQPPI
jgi:hypothetical protein